MGKTRTIVIGEAVQENKPTKPATPKRQKSVQKKVDLPQIEEAMEKPQEVKLEKLVASKVEKPNTKQSTGKSRPKSKVYLRSKKQIDNKFYDLKDAITLVKKTSYTKFDATVELHIYIISKKGQDPLRGLVSLPSGSPKQKKIAVADEQLIEKIKSGKIDFDILIASPAIMPKLAQVAKILGPKGMMPNPKSGTVTDAVEKVKDELSSGKIEYKTDPLGNIHIGVGKVSWDNEKIMANVNAVITAIPQNRINKVYLCATMGPSVRLQS